MSASVVVAVDGPSGSGKSSTSRGVATRLGLRYLDTGAMFRALTWWMLRSEVDVDDAEAVVARVAEPVIVSGTDPSAPTITVDGADVAGPIRSQEVTSAVSAVSAVPAVRARLLQAQREIIGAGGAGGAGGIVVEGRDIGTVVAPDAPVKVFLTADPGARAVRRTAEMAGSSVEAVRQDLIRRDKFDSGRGTAPLVMAGDAHHIDTSPYTLDEVIDQVVALVERVESATRA